MAHIRRLFERLEREARFGGLLYILSLKIVADRFRDVLDSSLGI
jgi:hypothetical protein